jgi:hypothetical protein
VAGSDAIPPFAAEQPRPVLEATAEAVLSAFAAVLERRPELAERFKKLLIADVREAQPAAPFMSITQYAARRCLSVRSLRYDVKKMTEGVHYHRPGQKRGRVVINVEAADAWYAERSRSVAPDSSIEQLAVDEVTRRRARVALNKRKEK